MSESILERLNRFTPDAGGLDRDALLFAAGRASARPGRRWKALASLLAGTQVLSLALLWPRANPPARGPIGPVAVVPEPTEVPGPPAAGESADPGVWSARHGLLRPEIVDRSAGDVTFVEAEPPLRAFPPPPSLLN